MLSLIEGRLGKEALPENHTLVDWPIGYDDLEPYYDRVEWELGISGRGSNIIDGSGHCTAPNVTPPGPPGTMRVALPKSPGLIQ